MKKYMSKFLQQLSLLGKAMLVPLAAMPMAGLLGLIFGKNMLDVPEIARVSAIVFSNMDFLFAVGMAGAGAKTKDKTMVITAGIISFWIFKASLASMNPTLSIGAFGGMLLGGVVAAVYNRTCSLKAPAILEFFSGEKCVVSLSPVIGLVMAFLFHLVWRFPQAGMEHLGVWLGSVGAFGVFLYLFLNRALIPIGLHQILNVYVLFEMGAYTLETGEVVRGEIPRFLAGDPTAGWYWPGLYLMMMFGIPAIALAVYRTAGADKKEEVKKSMLSGAFSSCVTSVTEPVEFSFRFASNKLYWIYALYAGLGAAALYLLGCRIGTYCGSGILDYVISYGYGSRAWVLFPVGILSFAVHYLTFKFIILHDDVETPGREKQPPEAVPAETEDYSSMAQAIIENCGGEGNFVTVNNCITRLRLEVKDAAGLNEENLKKAGAKGVIRLSETSVQIVIGTNVKDVREALDMELERQRRENEKGES